MTHLPVTVATQALALARRGDVESVAESALRALELYQASVYAQAAAMKVRDGGAAWITDGATIRASLSELGRPWARPLLRYDVPVRGIAAATVATEAAVLPIVAFGGTRLRQATGLALMVFHGGIKAVLDISFWHLWWQLVPALLWRRSGRRHSINLRGVGPEAAVAALVAGGNIAASVAGRNLGPFCAYNMFSATVPEEYSQLRLRVFDEDNPGGQVTDTRGAMPFEFFRTVSLLESAFVRNSVEDEVREGCARALLDGLNEHPWGPSDEVYPSLRQSGDPRVTGFDLLVMRTSNRQQWNSQAGDAERLSVVYSFRDSEDETIPSDKA